MGAGLNAWPGTDARTLAEKVVGGSTFPSAAPCYVVAGLLSAASGLVAVRSRTTGQKKFAVSHAGTMIVSSVLTLRGGIGLVVSSLGVFNETASFRRSNLSLYSPLCLALGALVRWSARDSECDSERDSVRAEGAGSDDPKGQGQQGR